MRNLPWTRWAAAMAAVIVLGAVTPLFSQALPQLDQANNFSPTSNAGPSASGAGLSATAAPPAAPASGDTTGSSGWGFPALPSAAPSSSPLPGQPSVWTRMSNGTTNFFKKTGEFLNPWDKPSLSKPMTQSANGSDIQRLGVNRVYNGSAMKRTTEKTPPEWYDPLGLYTGGEDPLPADVNDFLSRPAAWKQR